MAVAADVAFGALDFERLGRFFDELPTPVDHMLVTGPGPYYAPLAGFDFDAGRHGGATPTSGSRSTSSGTPSARCGPGDPRVHRRHRWPWPGGGLHAHLGADRRHARPDEDLALELAAIRVNLIAAGFVDTPLSASLLGDPREQLRSTLPIGRVVGPADIAALAVHFMTNTAVTGATYDIDGGQQIVDA
jgi:hypothetical protein